MTNKEREVLEIIESNPTIEQSEIARLLNISRSTVAVHISSLQKQGYLLGKGYIVNKQDYIVGIGACNVDIYGSALMKIRTHYDHPAEISSNVGGVMHNIICNYAKLSGKAKLITAYGDDSFGNIIINKLKDENIDVNDSLQVAGKSSGLFMQVQDENKDMYLALCDMSILESITPEYILSKQSIITNARLVVFDPSLRNDSIEQLISICKGKTDIYVDPISDNYAMKMRPYIGDLSFIKPNLSELEAMTKTKIENEKDIISACESLLKKGLKSILVSRGKDGVVYMDKDGYIIRKLKEEKNPVNMSGAGDALMATYIYGKVCGFEKEKILDYALAAGIAAIRSSKTINDNMSIDLLENILKEKKK